MITNTSYMKRNFKKSTQRINIISSILLLNRLFVRRAFVFLTFSKVVLNFPWNLQYQSHTCIIIFFLYPSTFYLGIGVERGVGVGHNWRIHENK